MLDLGGSGNKLIASMDELVRSFHTHLNRREYDQMESVWLELIDSGLPLERLLDLVEAARRHGPEGRAPVLLSVLAASLGERGNCVDQLRVLRRQAELMPDSAPLASEIARCLQRLHKDIPDLEQLLHKAGIGYGQSLKTALPKLDQYLSFLPGKPVLDPDRGPGRVKRLDLLLDRVTVDFDMGAELTWVIGAAARRLRVPAVDGYFAGLLQDRSKLVQLAADDPGRLVALYLRDVGVAQSVRQIQDGLAQVVSQSAWDSFWNRARGELGRNPHVVVRTTPVRTYQWTDTPQAGAAEARERANRLVRQRVTSDELAAIAPEKVVSEFGRLKTFAERKQFIDTLVAARPDDWPEILAALFRTGVDGRVRSLIERQLASTKPVLWEQLFESALTSYRQNPDAFVWLVEHEQRAKVATARGLLSRLLDLLESDLYKSHWTKLRNALVAGNYRLLTEALAEMSEVDASRLVARLRRIRLLEGFRADEMVAILAEHFPSLRQQDDEDVVQTTAAGLARAKQELRQMTEVEIPQVAEEIARARAHGDLSENYEYKAAKEKQARLMGRAKTLRDEIARARVVEPGEVDTSEVGFGCRVRLTDDEGKESVYTILGPWDTNPDAGVISAGSPLALLLIGRKVGETLETGGRRLTIAAIEPAL